MIYQYEQQVCNYLVTVPFTNCEFISYQHIKEVIDRQNIGAHQQWRS